MKLGNSKSVLGLKKGAWNAHEDMLLKNCIEKYGEGKWHLIPLKAGLNRCRKSCRLRWLNYLRPNIKRGDFAEDEIDLIRRLHKLLGNRWSLIAGRIPGRTANDVKNYWNSHLCSRSKQQKKEPNIDASLEDTTVPIIKPKPQTFSRNSYMCDNQLVADHDDSGNLRSLIDGASNNINMSLGLSLPPNALDDNINEYLDDIFDDHEKEIRGKFDWSFGGSSAEGKVLNDFAQEDDDIN